MRKKIMGIMVMLFMLFICGAAVQGQTAGTLFLEKKIILDSNNCKDYPGRLFYQDTSIHFEIPDNYYIDRIYTRLMTNIPYRSDIYINENFENYNLYYDEPYIFAVPESLLIFTEWTDSAKSDKWEIINIDNKFKFNKRINILSNFNCYGRDFKDLYMKEFDIIVKLIRYI